MSYLSNELIENGLHYNQLSIKQKYEVCLYWDATFDSIEPGRFEGSYRRLFENSKKMKTKYIDIYQFGVIDLIPENIEFRDMHHKIFATSIVGELYCLKSRERAKVVAECLGITSQHETDREIMRLKDLIDKNDDLIMEMAKELDKFEKEVQDLNDTVRHFAREGKVLFSEFMERVKVERAIEKPETQIYVKQLTKG